MNFDLKNMETYHYFILGGGGLVVIAILLYLLKGTKLKVSAFFATTLGAAALGFGAGVITLGAVGYNWKDKEKEEKAAADQAANRQGGGGQQPRKNQGGQAPKKNTASAKLQLAALIVKLNQLTDNSLTIRLDDRKAKVAEQLKDLDTMESVSEEIADARLKSLLELLKPDDKALTEAGFDLARSGVVGKGKGPPANPFTSTTNKAALKALQERVAQ